MLITTQNEIVSLMPTARWGKVSQLFGYLEEEERVALEPLLGTKLYQHLCQEYERLRDKLYDITATTVKPTGAVRFNPEQPYADVTERLDHIQRNGVPYCGDFEPYDDEEQSVEKGELKTIQLIRICQQIEWYKMLSHKAGLLTVSLNEGGGMNLVSADGYEPADEQRMERVVKDAYMSAGRAVDSLLLFLEADAKGDRLFTGKWSEADAFYLRKDLLFQTARVLNEYLDIKGERIAYVSLVRDIRFCQNTYLKPRIGAKLLKAVVDYANQGLAPGTEPEAAPDAAAAVEEPVEEPAAETTKAPDAAVMDELLDYLRTALAFYVECRRTEIGPKGDRLARRDSMTDAQQAMAMACQFIEDNLDLLGDAVEGSPIYKSVRAKEAQAAKDAEDTSAARRRQCRKSDEQSRRKLFTGFPATHIRPERK